MLACPVSLCILLSVLVVARPRPAWLADVEAEYAAWETKQKQQAAAAKAGSGSAPGSAASSPQQSARRLRTPAAGATESKRSPKAAGTGAGAKSDSAAAADSKGDVKEGKEGSGSDNDDDNEDNEGSDTESVALRRRQREREQQPPDEVHRSFMVLQRRAAAVLHSHAQRVKAVDLVQSQWAAEKKVRFASPVSVRTVLCSLADSAASFCLVAALLGVGCSCCCAVLRRLLAAPLPV